VAAKQLAEHLLCFDDGSQERLFVITPDPEQPEAVSAAADLRIVWFNFRALHDAIEAVTADPAAILAEQARFLLRELQALLVDEGLVDSDDVVIMAARIAYHEYLQHSAYICQVGRAFRTGLTHMGFYANAAIQTRIPRIRHVEDHVSFTDDEIASRKGGQQPDQLTAQVIESTLTAGTRDAGQQYQIFLLSGPEHPDTVQLSKPIINDTLSAAGKP
jgi:cell division protein ZapA (FtsZ GTPase activity inhibitor)